MTSPSDNWGSIAVDRSEVGGLWVVGDVSHVCRGQDVSASVASRTHNWRGSVEIEVKRSVEAGRSRG